eukprot:scaffold649042_cov56-Prasinocladus_malaysianus.AAC.1
MIELLLAARGVHGLAADHSDAGLVLLAAAPNAEANPDGNKDNGNHNEGHKDTGTDGHGGADCPSK